MPPVSGEVAKQMFATFLASNGLKMDSTGTVHAVPPPPPPPPPMHYQLISADYGSDDSYVDTGSPTPVPGADRKRFALDYEDSGDDDDDNDEPPPQEVPGVAKRRRLTKLTLYDHLDIYSVFHSQAFANKSSRTARLELADRFNTSMTMIHKCLSDKERELRFIEELDIIELFETRQKTVVEIAAMYKRFPSHIDAIVEKDAVAALTKAAAYHWRHKIRQRPKIIQAPLYSSSSAAAATATASRG